MNKEQEKVWDRLKHGLQTDTITAVIFYGNSIAMRFNSSWLDGGHTLARITVNDVAQSQYRDFIIVNNDVVFNEPPKAGHQVRIEVYNGR